MFIETKRLIIRDFDFKDEERLNKIIWQKDVVRFMKDWSENSLVEGRFAGYIKWLQSQKE